MKISILSVGKVKESYFRDAITEYSKRLSKYCKLEIIEVADEKTPDRASEVVCEQIKEKEAQRLMRHVREDAYVIALAIEGKQLDSVDVIYLDPMFPGRQKSGLINKKLQLIQKLEPPCSDEVELFEAAIQAKPSKIIVKRPLKSPFLAGKNPTYELKGKAIRYDCYAL